MINKYKIVVEGKNPDYFIDKLIRNNISIYALEKDYKRVTLVISEEGLVKLKKLKTSYKYHIIDSYGLVKFKYLTKRYLFFLICLFLGILTNVFLSRLIFNIEVIHPNSYIREIITNNLGANGICKYKFKVSFSEKEKIVEKILKKETTNIEWLEIEEIGTKYIVKVEQRKKNKPVEVCTPRNIIAKKDGMILEINADIGEVVKKKNDYVKQGDIIISGIIHNKEEVVAKRCATGRVYAEVWYIVNLELPTTYREEIVTGREKSQLELVFLNNSFTLFSNFKTYKRKSIPLISSTLLPISINYTNYLETNVINHSYDINNIEKEAYSLATSKLKAHLSKESEILSQKILKKQEKNSKIIVEVFVKVKEDITEVGEIVEIKE